MRQYTIHLPVRFNNGNKIPSALIDETKYMALQAFSGYTYEPTHSVGAWVDPDSGRKYIEHVTKIHVATDSPKKLNEFAKQLRIMFDQECMYVVETGSVQFI